MEETLSAIANLFLGFVGIVVFISTLVVRGIIWLIAIIANQFGWNLGHGFVNKVVLGLALLFSIYLGLGYFLLQTNPEKIPALYSPMIVFPAIILGAILWVGYFCAPTELTDQTGDIKIKSTDLFTKYSVTFLSVFLMFAAMVKFSSIYLDAASVEREKIRVERCLEKRQETGNKLTSLADKVGLGHKLSKDASDKLLESCK